MNSTLVIIGLLGAVLAVAFLGRVIHSQSFTIGGLANSIGAGVHEDGRVTLQLAPGATLATGGLFVTGGGAAGLISLCIAATRPLGVVWDEGAPGDTVAVELLGGAAKTRTAQAGATITAYSLLAVNAGGAVIPLPVAAGTYWVVGESLEDATAGDPVEFAPYSPYQVTVSA
ncbi:MAG: hypothetical protein LBK76_04525 [Verrucomicrobiales bacterium]|jgi:hypothetical protein|nr:hypothetical protein [Verrucomicrobiales bacterium]